MKVSWAEITNSGVYRLVNDTGWSAVAETDFIEAPLLKAVMTRVDEVTVTLEGSIKAKIDTNCSRCGRQLHLPLHEEFEYFFRLGSDHALLQSELECSDEDCSTVYLDDPIVNLIEVAEEQLVLAIPQKVLCKKNCKGVCPQCGTLLTTTQCHCKADTRSSPFAILSKLKK